jgi:hypothetical protein
MSISLNDYVALAANYAVTGGTTSGTNSGGPFHNGTVTVSAPNLDINASILQSYQNAIATSPLPDNVTITTSVTIPNYTAIGTPIYTDPIGGIPGVTSPEGWNNVPWQFGTQTVPNAVPNAIDWTPLIGQQQLMGIYQQTPPETPKIKKKRAPRRPKVRAEIRPCELSSRDW